MADEGWSTVSHKHKLTPRTNESIDDDGGDVVVYSPPEKRTHRDVGVERFVMILVGIPGSGKSSFATKLEKVR